MSSTPFSGVSYLEDLHSLVKCFPKSQHMMLQIFIITHLLKTDQEMDFNGAPEFINRVQSPHYRRTCRKLPLVESDAVEQKNIHKDLNYH